MKAWIEFWISFALPVGALFLILLRGCIWGLLFMYEETAWEFTRRMASHVGAVVIPAAVEGKAQIYFGYPGGGKEIFFGDDFYTVKIDSRYYEQNNSGNSKSKYICYEFDDNNLYEFGDYTYINNQKKYICGIYARLSDGILKFKYSLGDVQLLADKKYHNEKLSGVSLIGTVLSTYGEMVELHLDIDKEAGATCPFKWTPVTGNQMYLMPEIGTKASLYFQSADDHSALSMDSPRTNGSFGKMNAVGASSVTETDDVSFAKSEMYSQTGTLRANMATGNADYEDFESMLDLPDAADSYGNSGGGAPPMSNPSDKQLHTADGMEMNLTDSDISFIMAGASLLLNGGITGESSANISITAENKVEITGKNVSISTPSVITLVKP